MRGDEVCKSLVRPWPFNAMPHNRGVGFDTWRSFSFIFSDPRDVGSIVCARMESPAVPGGPLPVGLSNLVEVLAVVLGEGSGLIEKLLHYRNSVLS